MDFIMGLLNSMPGAAAQGLIWGIMAMGVYITYRILDVADLTVDGSLGTGGAVCVLLVLNGCPVWAAMAAAVAAGMLAGMATGLLHTACGIPPILAGILTQLALYSVNLRVMGFGTGAGKANLPVSVDKYDLLVSARYVREAGLSNPIFVLALAVAIVIGLMYWYFGTESGCSLRATGANEAMARAQGINTSFAKVLGLMISNGLVALSGALLAQYQGFSDINMGRGAIVIGLAAVIIGEDFQPGVPQLCPEAVCLCHWRSGVLCGYSGGAAHGPFHRRPQAAHRAGGGAVPGHSLLEGALLYKTWQRPAERGRRTCLK